MHSALFDRYPVLQRWFAEGGNQGPKFRYGAKHVRRRPKVEVVKQSKPEIQPVSKALGVARTFRLARSLRRICT